MGISSTQFITECKGPAESRPDCSRVAALKDAITAYSERFKFYATSMGPGLVARKETYVSAQKQEMEILQWGLLTAACWQTSIHRTPLSS